MSSDSFPYVVHSRFTFADEEEDAEDYQQNTNKSKSPTKERIITLTISKMPEKYSKVSNSVFKKPMTITESTVGDIPPYQTTTSFHPLNSSYNQTSEFKPRKNITPKPITQTVKLAQEENVMKPSHFEREIKEEEQNTPKTRTYKKVKTPKSEAYTQTEAKYLTPRSKKDGRSESPAKGKSSFSRTSPSKKTTSMMRMSELESPSRASRTPTSNKARSKSPQKTAQQQQRGKSPKKETNQNTNKTNRSRSPLTRKSPSPSRKPNRYTISNQTEVHDSPQKKKKSTITFGVYESVQIDILPDEEHQSPSKQKKESPLKSPKTPKTNKNDNNKENDDTNDTYITLPPHKTFRKFSPQRKMRTISKIQNKSTINNETNNSAPTSPNTNQIPSKIEHTQTVISPVRKDEEKFLMAQKFDTGYLQQITESNAKTQQTNNQDDDKFNENEFNEEDDFLSPQKLAPTQEVDDNESLSEFLQTEEKLRNEITTQQKTKAQDSVYEFIPYQQEKPKKIKKEAQVIPNYSKILKILRDFIPDIRKISLEMSKYKHEHMAILINPKHSNPVLGIFTLDLDHKMLKRIWGTSTKAIIEEKDIDTYYKYDSIGKKFSALVDKKGQNTVSLSKDIEAFSC